MTAEKKYTFQWRSTLLNEELLYKKKITPPFSKLN